LRHRLLADPLFKDLFIIQLDFKKLSLHPGWRMAPQGEHLPVVRQRL